MAHILKDLFAVYTGLVPDEKKEILEPDTNRWDIVSGLIDLLPYKKEDTGDNTLTNEDTSITVTPENSYSPTIQENASYLDFIYNMNLRLENVLTPPITTSGNTKDNLETILVLNSPDGDKSLIITNTNSLPSLVQDSINNNQSGYLEFLKHLRLYAQRHDISPEDKNMLIGIAALESSFNSKIPNRSSSASGWFLFVDNTRKSYSNVTKERFLNNSLLLIETAHKHLLDVKKQAKTFMDRYGTRRGLTSFLIVRGMWFRPESMRSYLLNGRDISNGGKEFVDSLGTTLEKVLNAAK